MIPLPIGEEPDADPDITGDLLDRLTISELLGIAEHAKVLPIMSERRTRQVVVDYVPARDALFLPRESPEDPPLEAFPPTVIPITYTLEDSMFGGITYVALTVRERVLIHPFTFGGYDDLATRVFKR